MKALQSEGRQMRRRLFVSACVAALTAGRAVAGDFSDWSVSPPSFDWNDWTASLGGAVGSTAYTAIGGGSDQTGVGLSALLFPRLERELDNGWQIGARGAVLAYHDRLAGDIYGDRVFEKASLFAQTPYGRLEIGQQDGAAYRMSITGPSTDDAVAIDNASTTFFRDPATGRAFIDMFRLQAAEFASANDAKFSYTSPRWFGLQLGGSYTPYDARGGLPFISRGEAGADRQTNLLEGAANYTGNVGAVNFGVYAGAVLGRDAAQTAGHDDLVDWGFGGEADYTIDTVKLAFGGALRQSNAYAFDIADTRAAGRTQSWRLATTATQGPWILGFEYAGGTADRADPLPGLDEQGTEASLGFVVNANLQLTLGWQELLFRRDAGVFFNGSTTATLNAEFLHLRFHV
jgi:hypothetical protein